MVKALLSAILILSAFATAHASPSATSKQAATVSSTQNYWLSDGLNRLVFWQSAAGSPQPEKKSAP